MYSQPLVIAAMDYARLPQRFRRPSRTRWADVNFAGRELDCFLEGPSFDRAGNLHVVDIPHGRIFRITGPDQWDEIACYDGWPNGSQVHRDGRLFVTDYRLGLLVFDLESGRRQELLTGFKSERFRGLNDLHFSVSGDLYFTDQGQSGLHDPNGRVFRARFKADGDLQVDCLIDNCPSPNGLVLDQEEKQLFVAMTRDNAIWRLPLLEDGTTTKVGRFIQLSGGIGPDGMALDADGGIVVAHPGAGVWRFDRRGALTHMVEMPVSAGETFCTNVAFKGHELFMVDSQAGRVFAARMPFEGEPLFSHVS